MGADPFGNLAAYDVLLTAVAVLLAVAVSQALPSVTERVGRTAGFPRAAWLAAGSVCLGAGVWAVDLAASLVVRAPDPARYAVAPSVLWAALAMLGTLGALGVVPLRRPAWLRALGGGLVAAAVLAAMHLGGLAALGARVAPAPGWQAPAALLGGAVVAWSAALWSAIRLSDGTVRHRWAWRVGSGLGVVAGAAAISVGSLAWLSAVVPGRGGSARGGALFLPTPETVVALALGVLAALGALTLAAAVDRRVRLRRAETEALRRSEDRFRALVQASAQIVWTTAPDGQMLGEQASWAAFTGQDAGEYGGSGWFSAIHPEDRERSARVWEETLANRRSAELEHRVRRHDGRYRDCVARVVPVLEPDGRVREWVGTHTDVTDRARMQEERDLLAEAGRVLSSSLDPRETLGSVARLIVPRLADWCAIDVLADDGGLRRLVATHQDPYRSSLLRDLDPGAGGTAAHGVMRVLRTGESELIKGVTETTLAEIAPDPDAALRLRELGTSCILWVPLTARGQVLGVLTLALAEAEEPYDLRDLALAEELARRSAIAIDNAGLYSESQSAIRAREEVLGVVSHDLRNPIGTVATAAELLLTVELPPDEHRRHLEIILRGARAANRLIRDLLDVSQTDGGNLAVDPRPADAARILTEACELMYPLAAERGQELTWQARDGLPPVQADPGRIQQVLSNLIGNAIKFAPAGGAVRVRVQPSVDGVQFSVLDTGPGIAPEELPRIFDRHWRATKTAHLGAGLGLAISRGIVEAHGGRIWAESRPGSGAAFHFTVPAAPAGSRDAESGGSQDASMVAAGPSA